MFLTATALYLAGSTFARASTDSPFADIEARDQLIRWMKETVTGLDRLRAGLPPDWIAGDKTGTGANGAANDVAIVWRPNRKPILIASYLSESDASSDARNAAHADIAATIAQRMV